MSGPLVRLAAAAAVCGALLLQTGQAVAAPPTATPDAAPRTVAVARAHKALRIGTVRGGSDGAMPLGPMISDRNFRGRLEIALRAGDYFAESGAAYEISVDMIDIQQPIFGSYATAVIRYTVKPVGGGEPVFDQTVSASGNTAINANIEIFVKRLAAALK